MGECVTVVVPTLNRGAVLAGTVRELIEQRIRPLEILVVDQSDDPDPEVLELKKAHPDLVNYRHVSFRGLPVARNYGWMNARHEVVIYVDDDVEVPAGFVNAHLEALRQERVGLVGGRIVEAKGPSSEKNGIRSTGRINHLTAVVSRGFDAPGSFEIDHVPGGNFSAWRGVIERAGGFDERLGEGAALHEETEFCLRVRQAGLRVVFEGAAWLLHLRSEEGGCRTPDVRQYVHSLARNRSVVIRRHVRTAFWPIALGRTLLYGLSYSVAYRRPAAFGSCLRGMLEGLKLGGAAPLCTGGFEVIG